MERKQHLQYKYETVFQSVISPTDFTQNSNNEGL